MKASTTRPASRTVSSSQPRASSSASTSMLLPWWRSPKALCLHPLFLAGKVEQERIQLMDLVPKYAKDLKPEALVALERKLLDSLRFQLVVRSPFRCLVGLLQDLHGVLSEAHRGEAGFAAGQLTSSLEALHRGAIDRVSEALRTDALFVYSPQQIALAALLSAADAAGSKDGGDSVGSGAAVRDFIERRFGTAQERRRRRPWRTTPLASARR